MYELVTKLGLRRTDNRFYYTLYSLSVARGARGGKEGGSLPPRAPRPSLFKAAILPYLTYCHLVWLFRRATDSRKLERVQERALRAIYCDRSSSYEKLLNMPVYPA